ncbi:MAG: hypothetical protein JOZ65_28790 [Chloroflexi bacterium]|nr:hypothetical protein [Chloroflexota bacterium]
MLTSARQERQLDPRYRRVLSFGDVLDESIGLFRGHWVVFALVSAACLLPPGLIELGITAGGALDTRSFVAQIETGVTPDFDSLSRLIGPLLVISLISGVFALAWTAAVIVATDDYVHGVEPHLGRVLSHVLRRYPIAFLAGLLTFLGVMLLAVAAMLLFIVSIVLFPIFILGTLGAIVGVFLWWLRPTMRTGWLKWLIILATPFGLVIYFTGTWSLALVAAVLEQQSPIGALRRSMQLVSRHWFRTWGILLVAGSIVSVLQYVPTVLVQLPLTILAFIRGQPSLSPTEQTISLAAGIVTEVLFASMASICYAILFIDLRNRREGTDIAERVSLLEALESD